jgi:hypothetical protein
MKKIYVFLFSLISFCGCSSFNLVNTVWYNGSPAELYGEKAIVYTTLYFGEDSIVNVNTSVMKDTNLIVSPCFTEFGTYTYFGTLKKGIQIHINTKDLNNQSVQYQGIICNDGMVLVSQDSIVKGYKMAKNLRLK